ncbi:beta-ketoacyl synthase, amino-terminal domain protein [Rhizoctonia solani 123E]|uniref:Beta-ketoacyl synthase, amino-terminal domain protein n=1 Tax=Rhizoctonia solani 123E TaxID=1423351 RepID=A0A074RFS8_9AGAM|nr:beta-ketoacyl synthase, amino-terminal domain protein [Rhizoctonia solani 123E]
MSTASTRRRSLSILVFASLVSNQPGTPAYISHPYRTRALQGIRSQEEGLPPGDGHLRAPPKLLSYLLSPIHTSSTSMSTCLKSVPAWVVEWEEHKVWLLCSRTDAKKRIYKKIFFKRSLPTPLPGWINLLLLLSSGPIKIPAGACATPLQSLEITCDTILSGKAKATIAGGFDDFSEEGSFELTNMKATSNTETEFAMGCVPNEFSRSTTSTRAGFMEAQGTGVQILMNTKTALEMVCVI